MHCSSRMFQFITALLALTPTSTASMMAKSTPFLANGSRSLADGSDLGWYKTRLAGSAVHAPACLPAVSGPEHLSVPLIVVVAAAASHVQHGPRMCAALFVHQSVPPSGVVVVVGGVKSPEQLADAAESFAGCRGFVFTARIVATDFQSRNWGMAAAADAYRELYATGSPGGHSTPGPSDPANDRVMPMTVFIDADDLPHPDMCSFQRHFGGPRGRSPSSVMLAHAWRDTPRMMDTGTPAGCEDGDVGMPVLLAKLAAEDNLPMRFGKPRPPDEPLMVQCHTVTETDVRPIGLSLPPGLPKFAMSHVALPRGPQDPVRFKAVGGEDQQFVMDMLRVGHDGNGGGGDTADTRCAYVHAFLSIKCKGEQPVVSPRPGR